MNIRHETPLEAFAPRISFYKETRAGKKRFVEALFPGYVFVNCKIDEYLRVLLSIRGISGVVRYGSLIPSLPEQTMAELHRRFPNPDEVIPIKQEEFQQGDQVVVLEGSFKGLDAIFDSYLPAGQRIQVLVKLLGRQLPVTVSRSSVLKEDSSSFRARGS